jgi:tetratricopeptide (TPR) repeat protein
MLKQFDFFNEPGNWFLPFYKENEFLGRTFGIVGEGFDLKQFAEGIERSNFLCNSDKYSFCLNIRHLPAFQKSTVMELFNMELKAMNELAQDDELINSEAADRVIITQYLQDLYRFYKLHPLKHEFEDVFNLPIHIHEAEFFRVWVEDTQMLRNIGEFFFEKNEYRDAGTIFLQIVGKHKSFELLEKIGYCYQKENRFKEALDYYHKAELLDGKRIWLMTRIAWCCRKTGQYSEAAEYYREAEKVEPENLQVQAWLGQTMMEMEDYDEALKYYFKVEYLQPQNHKVHRPISWCCFMLGKLDKARKYLEKSLAHEVTKNDYLNMGHICWCLNDKPAAIENYRNSLRTANMDLEWFAKTLVDDSPQLVSLGIRAFDIPLMIDYIMMSAGS